jgi:aspartate racemase
MYKKKIGVIGGMGSRAGLLFLNKIIDYSPANSDQEFPEIIYHNNSAVPDRTQAIVNNGPSPSAQLNRSVDLLSACGVDIIALACITSYYYYGDLKNHTGVLIINPLIEMAETIKRKFKGIRRVGLLATTGTVNSGLFHKALGGIGTELVTLDKDEQERLFMQAVYMKNGFKSACISDEARSLMARSVDAIRAKGIDAVIGGCTEVPLGVEQSRLDVPYIDTLDLLARKTVASCYNTETV